MTKPKFSLAAALLAGCCLAAPVLAATATRAAAVATASHDLRAQELHDLAVEAYVYLYPLVMMDTTRRMSINVPAGVKVPTCSS